MASPDDRTSYLERRRTIRARPQMSRRYMRRNKRIKGDLKAEAELAGLQMSDYDTSVFHIPYGFSWDAKKVRDDEPILD